MPLGTTLEADIKTAITNSEDASASATLIATAINNYLQPADYGDGAVLYSSSVAGSSFELAVPGTASAAATQWATAIMEYYGAGGIATGDPGEPTTLDEVIPPITITASTVGPALTTSLTSVFNNVGGDIDSKATDIASAIETAISGIVVNWVEFAAGPPPVNLPLVGGIS
jgi:hypothetical protein